MKIQMKRENQVENIDENDETCFYFYQSNTGENLFLHPLSMNILQKQYTDKGNYPTSIESYILEINYCIADQNDPEFKKNPYLSHLPNGCAYGLVELDMTGVVSP